MRRAALVLLAATGTLWATASAAMEGEAPTVALRLSHTAIGYGAEIVARGRVSLDERGQAIALEQRQGSSWVRVGSGTTKSGGAYALRWKPERGGPVRARLLETGSVSPAPVLRVRPQLRISVEDGAAFEGAPMRVRISPGDYDGHIAVRVGKGGDRVVVVREEVERGRARARVPTPGVGKFKVRVTLSGADGYESVTASGTVDASATPIAYGSSGPHVEALLGRLRELHYRVPAETGVFGAEALDAVLAFQKAEGLPRDGAADEDTWKALGRAKAPKPRFRKAGRHIEVDKTRQILMVVRDGEARSVVSVSTGATGNTPEGSFRIRWKAPSTTTWLGPGILYRTLTFFGNEFAIHGWPDVPGYAASHGCVRVPMWVADWLYGRSPVGERIFIYR